MPPGGNRGGARPHRGLGCAETAPGGPANRYLHVYVTSLAASIFRITSQSDL